MAKQIYLDYGATTPLDKEVFEIMLPYFEDKFGNPSSRHKKGKEALIAVDNARETSSKILNCKEDEIYFCGSGTEANNLAIFGIARGNQNKGKHLITTKIEHASVLEPFKKLEKEGFEVTYINVNKEGFIDIKKLESSIRKDTILVSTIYANNEIGTIQNIKKIGAICEKHSVPFHTDACQAATTLSLNTQNLNIDLMTLNGSKIYGPKGIGMLYKRRDLTIEPIIYGGGQEKSLRSGTENVPAIIGFAKALQLAQKNRKKENIRLTKLQNLFIENLLKNKKISLNGPPLGKNRLSNNINIKIESMDTQNLILQLNEYGIYVSTSSACSSAKNSTSHVLHAIGLSEKEAENSIRISLGKNTTMEDLEKLLSHIVSYNSQNF